MDEQLVGQVMQLDRQGLSAKAIARALGVGTRDVVGVLNGAVQVSVSGPGEPRCWVSVGWSHSVDLEGAPQWKSLDSGSSGSEGTRGLVAVLVAADSTGSAKAQVGGFLLDVWCLGVKNAMPPKPMTPRQLAEHKNTYFNNFGGQVQVPAELAQALVFGAAAYARELGFEPEADFNAAAALLGQPAGSSPIRFGRDGEPFYVSGPYDDVEAIMQTLRRTAGRDSFHADGAFPKESRRRLFRRGR